MKTNKKIIIGVIIAMVIAGLAVYKTSDKLVLFTLSKVYGLEVSYKGLTRDAGEGFVFDSLRIMNKKMGLGFFSQRASVKPVWKNNFFKTINFDFKFKDVHFIRAREEKQMDKYDTLSALVAAPFEGRWAYKEVSGEADMFSNGLTLKNFSASGREIRLTMSGDIFYTNALDVDISIYFSKEVLKDVPPELHSVIMKDEPNEWKSFSVKLKGDLDSPAIQVTGKLFRLNIGTVVMK